MEKFSEDQVKERKLRQIQTLLDNKYELWTGYWPRPGFNRSAYGVIINILFTASEIQSENFKDLVKEWYGESDNDSDQEYELAKLLTRYAIVSHLIVNAYECGLVKDRSLINELKDRYKGINLPNIKNRIQEVVSNYEINFSEHPPGYKPKVYEYIKEQNPKIKDAFETIFKNLVNEFEFSGALTELYKDIIDDKSGTGDELKSNNKTDNSIYKKLYNLIKLCHNVIKGGRHKPPKSKLELKTIGYAMAYFLSIMYKLREEYNVSSS